jgi:hypothetical protein
LGLPSQNFVVVDMHMLRRPSVAEPLVADYRATGQMILLPWRQLYEMAKSEQAVSTFAACVAPYLCEPNVLGVAHPSFKLAGDERRFRVKHATVVDQNETGNIHRMIASLRKGDRTAEAHIGAFLGAVRERALRILDHEDDPRVVKALAAWWKTQQTTQDRANEIQRKLRAGERASFRSELIQLLSLENLTRILFGINVGYKFRTIERISQWPSISALKAIAQLALGLHWRVMHGVEAQSKEKLVNDGSDVEYCLIALYGRSFYTEETKWRELYGDCQAVCHNLWPAS